MQKQFKVPKHEAMNMIVRANKMRTKKVEPTIDNIESVQKKMESSLNENGEGVFKVLKKDSTTGREELIQFNAIGV